MYFFKKRDNYTHFVNTISNIQNSLTMIINNKYHWKFKEI